MKTTPVQLTQKDRLELRKLQKQVTTWQQAKRLEAIRLLDQGLPVTKVAQQLCINKEVIYKYTRTFKTSGFDGLLSLNKPGKEAKLTDSQVDEIDRYLAEQRVKGNKYSHGDLVAWVKSVYGVDIGAKWLYKRLLFRRQVRLEKHLSKITTAVLIFQQIPFIPGFRRSVIFIISHGAVAIANVPFFS